jgi:hypothetical protein
MIDSLYSSLNNIRDDFFIFAKNPDAYTVVTLLILESVKLYLFYASIQAIYKFCTNLYTDIQLGLSSIFSLFFCVCIFLIQKNVIIGIHSDLDSYIISITIFLGLYIYVQCVTAIQPTYNITPRMRQVVNTLTTIIVLFIVCSSLSFNVFSAPVQIFSRSISTPTMNDITKVLSLQFVISFSTNITPVIILSLGEFFLITILILFEYLKDKKVQFKYISLYTIVVNTFYFAISDLLYIKKANMLVSFSSKDEANKFISDISKIIFKKDIYVLVIITIVFTVFIIKSIEVTLRKNYDMEMLKKLDYKLLLKKVSKEIKLANGEINSMQISVIKNIHNGVKLNYIQKKDIEKLICLIKNESDKKIVKSLLD